jgi:hypothetical protein
VGLNTDPTCDPGWGADDVTKLGCIACSADEVAKLG